MLPTLCLLFGLWCESDEHHYHVKPDLSHPVIEHNLTAPRAKPSLSKPVYWDSGCKVSPKIEYKRLYIKAAQKHPSLFDACLLATQGQAESNFNPNAVSPVGAEGIAQIMPKTAQQHGIDPFDPEESILFQASYIKWNQDLWTPGLGGRTDFDLRALTLACYNHGRGATLRNQKKYGWVRWVEADPHMPTETQNYIKKILL